MAHEDHLEPVPPCRVLMRDGVPCEEIITVRPRRDDFWGDEVDEADPENSRQPRHRPKRLRVEITRAKVLALRDAGQNVSQIAATLRCTTATIYNRLHER